MNATEERERVAALRSGAAGFSPPKWRTHTALVQILFFVLTAMALGAFVALCELFRIQKPGVLTGIVAIAVAELLIRKRRWFGTGVEGALWLGGLFGFIKELPSSGKPESLLVIAAACAIAGWRVRNPIFGALAALAVAGYFEWKFDRGVLAALLFGAAAMLLMLRTWRRPSTEWLLIAIALGLPFAGWWMAGSEWRETTIMLYTGYAALAFSLGIVTRHHAMLLSGMIATVIAGTEISRIVEARVELKLFVCGAALLVIAFVLTRLLRRHTTGIVLTPASLTPHDEVLQIGATPAAQPQAEAPAEQPDGRFGGAGASGGY